MIEVTFALKMRFLPALAALAAITVSLPVEAGLGSATTKTKSSIYEAWCGVPKNDCTISFNDGKITVDGTDSIDFEQITYITENRDLNEWTMDIKTTFGIEYLEEGAEDPEFAEVIFLHRPTAKRFWRDLKRACRNCKDRDATQIDVNVKN